MANHTCIIRNCSEPAIWQVKTIGHPNTSGVLTTFYCPAHLKIAAWHESPQQYKIEVTGPLPVSGDSQPSEGS
ncbi:hypothetical protein ACTXJG_04855 [Glutamicibacter arilaitensis]|uniref:hypothetical protein n=1 Tax=Glutamicibacter arilaitensis TaxID=256701 RepID=UPI003FD210CB